MLTIRIVRGVLELERDRNAAALAALEAGDPLARRLAGPTYFVARIRALLAHSLVRLGETDRAEEFLAGLGEPDRQRGEIRIADATLRLAQGDPQAALAMLGRVQEHPVPEDSWGFWRAQLTYSRPSPETHSATPTPLTRPSSAHWTCPSAVGT